MDCLSDVSIHAYYLMRYVSKLDVQNTCAYLVFFFFFFVFFVLFCFVFVLFFFFSSRRRHTRSGRVTGVQTCALPIYTGVKWRLGNPRLDVRPDGRR